jgi:hypothetical protein
MRRRSSRRRKERNFSRVSVAQDTALRHEAESLLAQTASSFLETLPSAIATPKPFALSSGARLGPYRVIEPLGRGGMGEMLKSRRPCAFLGSPCACMIEGEHRPSPNTKRR